MSSSCPIKFLDPVENVENLLSQTVGWSFPEASAE